MIRGSSGALSNGATGISSIGFLFPMMMKYPITPKNSPVMSATSNQIHQSSSLSSSTIGAIATAASANSDPVAVLVVELVDVVVDGDKVGVAVGLPLGLEVGAVVGVLDGTDVGTMVVVVLEVFVTEVTVVVAEVFVADVVVSVIVVVVVELDTTDVVVNVDEVVADDVVVEEHTSHSRGQRVRKGAPSTVSLHAFPAVSKSTQSGTSSNWP